ncbi:MAG: 2-phospho-L-lactate transferase CofD family protein [Collinsella sp.]
MSEVRLEPACLAANEGGRRGDSQRGPCGSGPGSLFTSIIPNVLVPGIRDALAATSATRVFVCPKIDSLRGRLPA